jgi:hypothetical protein
MFLKHRRSGLQLLDLLLKPSPDDSSPPRFDPKKAPVNFFPEKQGPLGEIVALYVREIAKATAKGQLNPQNFEALLDWTRDKKAPQLVRELVSSLEKAEQQSKRWQEIWFGDEFEEEEAAEAAQDASLPEKNAHVVGISVEALVRTFSRMSIDFTKFRKTEVKHTIGPLQGPLKQLAGDVFNLATYLSHDAVWNLRMEFEKILKACFKGCETQPSFLFVLDFPQCPGHSTDKYSATNLSEARRIIEVAHTACNRIVKAVMMTAVYSSTSDQYIIPGKIYWQIESVLKVRYN